MIIGFTGYAGSGKDEAGRALIAKGFTRVSFADKLKVLAIKLDPLIAHWVFRYDWEGAKKVPHCREFLQTLGMTARDVLGEDVWVNAAMNSLETGRNYVFTDVRYPNEYQAIRQLGGTVYRITRLGVGPVNDHVSETALDSIDMPYISNEGTLLEFQRKVIETTLEF